MLTLEAISQERRSHKRHVAVTSSTTWPAKTGCTPGVRGGNAIIDGAHRLHFEAAVPCRHPGACSPHRVDRRGTVRRLARLVRLLLRVPLRTTRSCRTHSRSPSSRMCCSSPRSRCTTACWREAAPSARCARSPHPSSSARSTRGSPACSSSPCAPGGSPVPGVLYQLTGPWRAVGWAGQLAGLLLTIRASSALDVLDLAGVRAGPDAARTRTTPPGRAHRSPRAGSTGSSVTRSTSRGRSSSSAPRR